MTRRRWDDDDALLADLADAVTELGGLQHAVAELGRGAFAWLTMDQDLLLASLSYDSVAEPTTTLRSSDDWPDPHDLPGETTGGPRTLVFSSTPLSVELEVLANRVVGQLSPPSTGTILIEAADGVQLAAEADELGFFMAGPVPRGLVRIRCDTPVARLVTDWIRL